MSAPSSLDPLLTFLSYSLLKVQDIFFQLPGSAVIARYVRSSHQNDPGRTALELILVVFAVRTLLQSRTRTDRSASNFVKLTEKVCALHPLAKSAHAILIGNRRACRRMGSRTVHCAFNASRGPRISQFTGHSRSIWPQTETREHWKNRFEPRELQFRWARGQ